MSDPLPLDLAAELTAQLAPETVDPFEELAIPEDRDDAPRPRWRVDTDERADYALRRVLMADEEAARLRGFANQQKAQIDEWLAVRLAGIDTTRTFFLGAAADYGRRLREADPKFRTLALPAGKVTAHDKPAGVDVVDAEAFCAWALALGHDDVVKVDMAPKLREVARRYTVTPDGSKFATEPGEDGEVVPGLVPRPAGWRADAKPAKPGTTDEEGVA